MQKLKHESLFDKLVAALHRFLTKPKSEIERRIDNARKQRRSKERG